MYNRLIFEDLKRHLEKSQITIITVLRKIGKSTALKFLLVEIEHNNKTYIGSIVKVGGLGVNQ